MKGNSPNFRYKITGQKGYVMLATIIGIEIKSGTFIPEGKSESVAYNNLWIYAIKDNTYEEGNNFGKGCLPVTLKIKNEPNRISKIFGCIPTMQQLDDMVDQVFELYFNEKGVIDKIVSPEVTVKPAEKKGA